MSNIYIYDRYHIHNFWGEVQMKFCKEKIILLVCLLLMSMVVFAGCSPDSGNVDSSKNKTHLKVGTDAFQRPAVDACVDALAEMAE